MEAATLTRTGSTVGNFSECELPLVRWPRRLIILTSFVPGRDAEVGPGRRRSAYRAAGSRRRSASRAVGNLGAGDSKFHPCQAAAFGALPRSSGDRLLLAWIAVLAGVGCTRSQPLDIEPHRLAQGTHRCLVRGSGSVWCSGYNRDGQLGDGTNTNRSELRQVRDLEHIVAVSVGGALSCALDQKGRVACFGAQNRWQSSRPQTVEGLPRTVEVAVGGDHSCARSEDGAMYCWGCGLAGQLGTGHSGKTDPQGDRSPFAWVASLEAKKPTRVLGLGRVRRIAVGSGGSCNGHSCAIDVDGRLWCWGENRFGAVGDGSPWPSTLPDSQASPTWVVGLKDVTQVALGAGHSCAIHGDAQLSCWGLNDHGQLGDGTLSSTRAPVLVPAAPRATAIAAGMTHSCLIDSDGALYCFGANTDGQLGTGDTDDRRSPTKVEGLAAVVEVTAGPYNTCARTGSDEVYCFGREGEGPYWSASATPALRPRLVR